MKEYRKLFRKILSVSLCAALVCGVTTAAAVPGIAEPAVYAAEDNETPFVPLEDEEIPVEEPEDIPEDVPEDIPEDVPEEEPEEVSGEEPDVPVECAHSDTEEIRESEVEATCTKDGSYDLVVYCIECGKEISRKTVTVKATGHNWGSWKVESNRRVRRCKNDSSHKQTQDIALTGVKLSAKSITLEKGKSKTIKATISPSNATNQKLTWTTSNKKVATVSNGKITAKGKGTATITVKTANGKKASCKVTVKISVSKLKLNKERVFLRQGKSQTLKLTITPSDAQNKKVTWKSADTKTATVKNGKVTAKKVGTTTVTVTSANGKKTSCKVTVLPKTQKVWNGKADTSWYKSSKDSFEIYTAEQLAGLSKLVRNGNSMKGKTITLIDDIVLNDTSNYKNWGTNPPKNNWTPIGIVKTGTKNTHLISYNAEVTEFEGCFDGNGHTIKGLYSHHDNMAGLFASVNEACVLRTVIQKGYVKAQSRKNHSWDTLAGGIAATAQRSIIAECEFNGKVVADGLDTMYYGVHDTCAGGIIGKYTDNNDCMVFNFLTMGMGFLINPLLTMGLFKGDVPNPGVYCCINRGSVSAKNATGECGAGGIVGNGSREGGIMQCVNLGKVSSANGSAGGMVGTSFKFQVKKSYYTNTKRGLGKIIVTGENCGNGKKFKASASQYKTIVKKLGNYFTYKNKTIYITSDLKKQKH